MQREQPKISAKRAAVKAVKDLSLLQKEKPKQKKSAGKQLDSTLNWMRDWSTGLVVGQQKDSDFGACAMAGIDLTVAAPPTTILDTREELPTGTPETFLAYIQRDINCLSEDTMNVRLQSLQKLERILVRQGDILATDVVDADKSEKCRELAVKILRSLVENTSDLAAALPYVFPTLVSRLGCEDLDGVAHLPEAGRNMSRVFGGEALHMASFGFRMMLIPPADCDHSHVNTGHPILRTRYRYYVRCFV
eukprot:s3544_g6.t1